MRPLDPAGPELTHGRWRLLRARAHREMPVAPAVAWAVISDHTTWTTWQADYRTHEAETPDSSGIGARFRTVEWVFHHRSEIVRWEPPVALGWTIVEAGSLAWLLSRYYSELVVEPVAGDPDSCVVRAQVAFSGTWLFWLLGAYTVGQSLATVTSDTRSSLRALERLVVEAAD
ncbi:MAG: SRPBCC family protein [Actinomycetota bacterium]